MITASHKLRPATRASRQSGVARRSSTSSWLRGGFTLLELILGLSLLALFTVMVTGVMRSSLRTVFWAREMQLETDQLNRFILLCRQTFQNLPSTAILTLKITETGVPVQQELTISGVPEAFAFGTNPMSYKDSILGLRPDLVATEEANSDPSMPPPEGEARLYFIGLSREDLIPTDPAQANRIASTTGEGLAMPDEQGRVWMPLLADVTSVSWRFYKEDEDLWKEEWDSTDLPQLVEMNLMLQGRTLSLRSVFALPTTKLTAANPSLAPRTSTQTSTSSSQQSGGGNNGGNNRGGGGDRGSDRGGDRGRDRGDMRGGDRGRGGSDTRGGDRGGAPDAGRGGPPPGGGRSGPGGAPSSGGGGSPSGGNR